MNNYQGGYMCKPLICGVLLLSIFFLNGCFYEEAIIDTNSNMLENISSEVLSIRIERLDDLSIRNEKNELIADISYEIPVITGENTVVTNKINSHFEDLSSDFINDTNQSNLLMDDSMKIFIQHVNEKIKYSGDADLVVSPFFNRVLSDIIFFDENIMSIRQKFDWMAGGVYDFVYRGEVFDLNTGEKLTLDYFIEDSLEVFNEKVISNIKEQLEVSYRNDLQSRDDILTTYQNYKWEDYNFYYDGKNVYIIMGNVYYELEYFEMQYAVNTFK